MDQQQLWTRYAKYFTTIPSLGFSVDISRMRFADDFFKTMQPKIEKAFSDMAQLEKGDLVNPDEKRMVGHYWLRNPESAPTAEISKAITTAISDIKKFAKDIHDGTIKPEKQPKFKNVLVVGIGGSALGPQLVAEGLSTAKDPMKVFFFDNTDPDGMAKTLQQIGSGLDATVTIVVSKSGGTIETRNGCLEAEAAYKKLGVNFKNHVVAVTCPGSKLDGEAERQGWLRRFPMWDWVGGRTSLFSAVGLLPAALQGINIDDMLAGAKEMDAVTRGKDMMTNPAALLSLMWYAAGDGQGKKDMVVLPYKDRLCLFSKYLQQLVMESLGKEKDLTGKVVHQGIAVYGNKGSTDQHAYVQQLRDGLNNFFATFIEVLEDYTPATGSVTPLEVEPGITSGDYLSGFFLGTRRALYENERDSITITMDQLNAKTLGALIAVYDRTVGFYASLVGINAYHQPGVEAGKKAAAQVIELQKRLLEKFDSGDAKNGLSASELGAQLGCPEESETIYKIAEHLAANGKISRAGSERHPEKAKYKSK